MTAESVTVGEFLRVLWGGGAWAYYWRIKPDESKKTLWFPAQTPPPAPAAWAGSNVYLGVNTTARSGNTHSRALAAPDPAKDAPAVTLIGALFCEWDCGDGKPFADKRAIVEHNSVCIGKGLPPPSVLIDSGGGLQAYWLLAEPLPVDDANRAEVRAVQAGWVALWGGDGNAKDIARVLRLPGTENVKYEPPRPVLIHQGSDLRRRYPWTDLAALAPRPAPAAHTPAPTVAASVEEGGRAQAYATAAVGGEVEKVRNAPEGMRNYRTNQSAFRLGRLVGGGVMEADGLEDALTAAAVEAGLPEKEARREARNGLRDGRERPKTLPEPRPRVDNGASPRADDAPGVSFHCTDMGNAQRLVAQHGRDLRYCFPWASWLAWNGRQWRRDGDGEVFRRAKAAVGSIYAEAAAAEGEERRKELAKWAMRSEARDRVAAMIDQARSEFPLPVLPENFDRDPWLLNVANGTVNLRTGALQPHAREDLLSKIAPVAYDPAALCPRWLAFLHRIMGGDETLIDYLRRAVGYSLTGDVSEQVLFFLHGSGSNGKSTFLATILAMLGRDYGTQAAPELLIAGSRHPTEVADLHGKRFVASIEVEDGRRMAEGLVKQMTGGDQMKARFMKADFFQFDPTFKLFLSANHKPTIKGTDYAIWRRIRLIPFTVTIDEREKDPQLPDKLRTELPGILAWAVRGCLAWQNEGLPTPAAVADATAEYRAESDLLGAFLTACTITKDGLQVQAKDFYAAYVTWCEANGEKPLTGTRFGREMTARGADKYQDRSTRHTFYVGLGLLEGTPRE